MTNLSLNERGRPDARTGNCLASEKRREFHCHECNARCTRGTTGTEYGHAYGCPERPETLPAGDSTEFQRRQNRGGA